MDWQPWGEATTLVWCCSSWTELCGQGVGFVWTPLFSFLFIYLFIFVYLGYFSFVFVLCVYVGVYVCHSPWSWGSRAGLVIASHYTLGESLQLVIAQSMGKAVTFHTPHTPSSCSRRTVTAWSSVKRCTVSKLRTRTCWVTSWDVTTELPSSVCVCLFFLCVFACTCVYTFIFENLKKVNIYIYF